MMEIRQTAGTRRGHQAGGLTLGAVLAGCLLMPGPGQADDLTECMINRMQQVDDTMTVGELRLKCQKQLHSGEYVTQGQAGCRGLAAFARGQGARARAVHTDGAQTELHPGGARTISVVMIRLFIASRPETRISTSMTPRRSSRSASRRRSLSIGIGICFQRARDRNLL